MEKLSYPMNATDGAAALDSIMPGWFYKINLNKFDMDKCDTCIIGQLNDGDESKFASFIDKHFYPIKFGSIFGDGAFGFRSRNKSWIAEINKRLKPYTLFRGPQLRVRVLRRHYNQSKKKNGGRINFIDIFDCPIACAVKELFPNEKVTVGFDSIRIGMGEYILVNGSCRIVEADKPFTCTIVKHKQ